jgi:hypothetical protein
MSGNFSEQFYEFLNRHLRLNDDCLQRLWRQISSMSGNDDMQMLFLNVAQIRVASGLVMNEKNRALERTQKLFCVDPGQLRHKSVGL